MIRTLLVLGTAAGLMLASGAASAGMCTTEIEDLQKKLSSSDAGMGPTGGGTTGTGIIAETGQLHPPTGAMNEETQGKATSSEDVLSQNQGAPTDSDASAASQYGTAAGGAAQATESLERARQFDQAGDEVACMGEIDKAKALLGTQ